MPLKFNHFNDLLKPEPGLFYSFEVARHICDDSYGLVFGFNTFLALFFQSILTFIVADDAGLALPPRSQVKIGFYQGCGILPVR